MAKGGKAVKGRWGFVGRRTVLLTSPAPHPNRSWCSGPFSSEPGTTLRRIQPACLPDDSGTSSPLSPPPIAALIKRTICLPGNQTQIPFPSLLRPPGTWAAQRSPIPGPRAQGPASPGASNRARKQTGDPIVSPVSCRGLFLPQDLRPTCRGIDRPGQEETAQASRWR